MSFVILHSPKNTWKYGAESVSDEHQPSSQAPIVSTPILPRYAARPSTLWDEAVMSLSGIRRLLGTLSPSSLNPQPKGRFRVKGLKYNVSILQ